MEQQLEQLVREQGFEQVFTTLKTIVTREHERAKRDFDFLQTLIVKTQEAVPEAAAQETKTIEIPQTVKMSRKIIRKPKEKE
jgi:hypothetical protein